MIRDDRGQAYTLEGVIAAIIIASSVMYGLQAVDVAPWSSGADDQRVDELRVQAQDTLDAAADNGTLRAMVTCTEPDGVTPHTEIGDPDDDPTEFGPMLNTTFAQNGYNYNVYLHSWNGSMETYLLHPDREQIPNEEAVSASHRVLLHNVSYVSIGGTNSCRSEDRRLSDYSDDELYLPRQHDNSGVYAVVEVRIVVW